MFHKIQSTTPLSEYSLLVCFENGEKKIYDVRHTPYRTLKKSSKVNTFLGRGKRIVQRKQNGGSFSGAPIYIKFYDTRFLAQ